jgi:23S rRNA (guanosine2251-2'-O)-methyltransferase
MNQHRRKTHPPRAGRRGSGQTSAPGGSVIYGWHSALAALQNPRRTIRAILATPNARARLAELSLPNLPEPIATQEIERMAGRDAVHQGIAVVADPLPDRDLSEFADAGLLVVLDQVTDPHNVGAILRSAAAFGATALVMTERHGPQESGVLAKAASGGLEYVALVHVKNLARAMDELGELGFLRVGLDSEHAESIETVGRDDRVALVLGAEGKGLRRLTREKCDRLVRLDVPGPIASLNVSNAAAIALYALSRR